MTDGRWPMADGRWPMADGRWPQTVSLMIGPFIGPLVIDNWSLVISIAILRHPIRNNDAHQQPAFVTIAKLEPMRIAIKMLKPGTRVGDSDPFCRRRTSQPISVVPQLQH